MSKSIPLTKESRRAKSAVSRAISFSGLLRMSSSSNFKKLQTSVSFSEAPACSNGLREWIVEMDGVGFESFMALTLSALEALVMLCFFKSQSDARRREGRSLIRALGPVGLRFFRWG